jgi:hypothetical protein
MLTVLRKKLSWFRSIQRSGENKNFNLAHA